MNRRELAACHEAAHALCRHQVGHPIEQVALWNNGSTWTRPKQVSVERAVGKWRPGLGPADAAVCAREPWLADGVTHVAGIAAELMLTGRPDQGFRKSPPDLAALASCAAHAQMPSAEYAITALTIAQHILREHWPAFEQLTRELLGGGTVSGERVAEIVAEHAQGRRAGRGRRLLDVLGRAAAVVGLGRRRA